MDVYNLTVSLTKLSSNDFPEPTIPETIYKAHRIYLDEDGENAKEVLKILVEQVGLEVVDLGVAV